MLEKMVVSVLCAVFSALIIGVWKWVVSGRPELVREQATFPSATAWILL